MLGCLSSWTLYDVIAYFYGPFVDDDGNLPDDFNKNWAAVSAADIWQKVQDIRTQLDAVFPNGNFQQADLGNIDEQQFTKTQFQGICADILEQFQQIQVHDDDIREYHGATWKSVCRAEGSTKYIKFSEIRDKIDEDAANQGMYTLCVYVAGFTLSMSHSTIAGCFFL